jgi:hypothetical protein
VGDTLILLKAFVFTRIVATRNVFHSIFLLNMLPGTAFLMMILILLSNSCGLPSGFVNVEGKMFKDCTGMFSVADYYYSCILSYKSRHLSTNHLLLPDEAKPIDDESRVKYRRVQWIVAMKFAGECLESVKTPKMLLTSIIHAILGNDCIFIMVNAV